MASAVTQKGQVTIPKRVRDAMGVRPGTLVEVESDGQGGARIVKVAKALEEVGDLASFRGSGRLPDPLPEEGGFARFVGIGLNPDGQTTDEYMAMIRDEIDA